MALQEVHRRNDSSPALPMDLLQTSTSEDNSQDRRCTILTLPLCAAVRQSVTKALQGLDHQVLTVKNTAEAATRVRQQPVDLVCLDLSTPGVSVDLCRNLREAAHDSLLPVIVIARQGGIEAEISATEAGADAFFSVPLNPLTLRARVQACLRRKALTDSMDDTETVLLTLAQSVEERDPVLGKHCERLALMAAATGVALGLRSDEILSLQRAGFLHDVGKVAIPDSVLFKPGPLTSEEWVIMQSHAERGERICSKVRSLAPVLPIIRHHHERWDGSGYPDKLKGEAIPLLARILQLADIYDALTTARPYKRAFTTDEARRMLAEEAAKGWRDPMLVNTFINLLPIFQTPTMAELSDLSLQALATAVYGFRKGTDGVQDHRPVKLASGL